MLKQQLLILLAFCLITVGSNAQEKEGVKPNFYSKTTSMKVVPSLASRGDLIPAEIQTGEAKDGRSSRSKVIIGKGSTGDDLLAKNNHFLTQKTPGRTPELVFDTIESSSQPTDPSLATGPDHVLAVYNTGYRIFDKNGAPLTGGLSPDNIFSSGSCCDLTISYDNLADRWVMTILYSSDGHVEVAVSTGSDPINDAWTVYSIPNVVDYNKLTVWSDGYYLTGQVGGGVTSGTTTVWALEREAMIAGDASAQIIGFPLPGIATSGFYSPLGFNITNNDFPAAGNAPIVFLQDDAYTGVTEDHIKIWTINADYTTPANSTISQPVELVTTPFVSIFDGGAFSNLTQPNGGQDIDALQAIIMNQPQFRKFPTHNSAVFNFVVDADASGELAAVRWYELRQSADGQPWSIYQEGTYTAPDGKHAWNASLAMDAQGNIGMGYTGMGGTTDTFVSSYYTGRFANDPLGTMTISETLIAAGSTNIPGSERYGDYSKIDVDPSNDKKFWFVNEYMNADGNRANVAGVFQIAPNFTNDVGVTNINLPSSGVFSATEEIKVNIFNFGQNDASNFDVTYQIDGGAVVTETFTGTLASATGVEFTFAQTADLSVEGQTYNITSSTVLTGDEDATNDSASADVTNLFLNDLGVTEITSPVSGEGLGSESVIVTITNFGGEDKSNFSVSYTVNGGAPVQETVAGPIAAGGTLSYTFTQAADLSVVGDYVIVATTSLANDADNSNDSTTVNVSNLNCQSTVNDTAQTFGASPVTITSVISITDDFILNDVNLILNVTHGYVEDVTATLTAPDGTTVVELTSLNGGSGSNYVDTIFDDAATNAIVDAAPPFTGSFQPEGSLADFNGLSSLGDWTLTLTDVFPGADDGELLNWTLQLCGNQSLSIGDNFDPTSEMKIISKGQNQFKIQLNTDQVTEKLNLDIFNMLGQRLLNYKLENEGGNYSYDLDMSYANAGVYIVKLSDKDGKSKVGRIVKR